MKGKKLLVIGGVAAGAKTAAKARREDDSLEITMLSNEDVISYAGCGLPYYIGGIIEEEEALKIVKAESFEKTRRIKVELNTEAVSIDPAAKSVSAVDLVTGEKKKYGYDTLVIATGALPLKLPGPGSDLENIYNLRTIKDSNRIKEKAKETAVKKGRALVVGSGFIGIETAENLLDMGIETIVVEMKDQILPGFDYDIALSLQYYMEQKGLKILTEEAVTGFSPLDGGRISVSFKNHEAVDVDFVVSAAGVRANTAIASDCGIETGIAGAIKVDDNFETNIKDVFAVGDCAEMKHRITGKTCWVPLGSTANKMGRIMAENRFGGAKEKFPGVLGTMIIKVFDMTAGKTGLTERDAAAEGYDFDTVIVPGNDSAGYYPGFREIVTKLIYERKNGRILGGQVFGWGVVDKPVDILVTAISFNATIFDLAHLDLAYAPPFSNAMASTIASSNTAKNRMSQRVKTIHPFELYSRWEKNELTVLDVRTDEEVEEWSIERSLHIENTYLPDRLGELDKNRKYAIVCKRGIRAYNAYRLLEAAGFRDLAVLAGGTVFSQPLIEMLKAGKPCGNKKL